MSTVVSVVEVDPSVVVGTVTVLPDCGGCWPAICKNQA